MKPRVIVRVGILFATAVVVLFWGLNYLKGRNFLKAEKSFIIQYDKIGGLVESSPVTINGFQIGQVRKISLNAQNPEKIVVNIILTYPDIKLPRGTIAQIYSTDLMGTKGIALKFSKDTLYYSYGDTLQGDIEGDLRDQVNTQMLPLKAKAENLMASMDSVLLSFQLILNEQSRKMIRESFTSVNTTLGTLETTSVFLDGYVKTESEKISGLLNTIDSISRSLQSQSFELRGFLTNLKRFSDTLNHVPIIQAIESFNQVLDEVYLIANQINSGKGSLGLLLKSDTLYNALLVSNQNLNRLMEDIRIHPQKYVHFSLIDQTKTVYTPKESSLARILADEGIQHYYLCVHQSPTPLGPDHQILKDFPNASYIRVGNLYYYYVYESKDPDKCRRRIKRIRKTHPSAGIYTWVNGKWILLDF